MLPTDIRYDKKSFRFILRLVLVSAVALGRVVFFSGNGMDRRAGLLY